MKSQIPNSTLVAGVIAFNAQQWAEAFMLFQTHWLEVRSDECKALAQYANALNQLTLGLTTAPRTMLTRVLVLTAEGTQRTGIDIPRMRKDVAHILANIPAEDAGANTVQIPPVLLEWRS